MKKFAFFLPQFHEIQENNEWWGEGFTEWVNVKKAEPLYSNHIQPIHPENDNYYNLLEKETVEWQTRLLHEYNVDGLIYYHYYFKGKMLLEKPAENLLNWKDINQPFFFCWANHSWKKTWNGTSEMLMEQVYGDESDWENHFNYLLPFFKDERYEKKDNMPLFMVFNRSFKEKEAMFSFFDKKCKENGFAGLYLIETFFGGVIEPLGEIKFSNDTCSVCKAEFYREPSVSMSLQTGFKKWLGDTVKAKLNIKSDGKIKVYEGDELYRLMNKEKNSSKVIHGLFFSWDNTPRHGNRGYVINPVSREVFLDQMDKWRNQEYVFINAWNEWCEGMIMEPTKEYGNRYLEWMKEV